MKKIIAFAGSNSKASINKQLVTYVVNQIDGLEITILDLNDFELPLYGIDLENESGIPENAKKFNQLLESADGYIISLAEHNTSFSAVFKNTFDWLSRIDMKVWNEKPMLLMATSPGRAGGKNVLAAAKNAFPYFGGKIVADFSLPSFNHNFSEEGVVEEELASELRSQITKFIEVILK